MHCMHVIFLFAQEDVTSLNEGSFSSELNKNLSLISIPIHTCSFYALADHQASSSAGTNFVHFDESVKLHAYLF
ncbi:unnamed protein product, partial [Prunus brigantina]